MTTKRGTSNGNSSGNSEDRRRRKAWLLETYAADTTAWVYVFSDGATHVTDPGWVPVRTWLEPYILREDVPACRCYRCGKLLIFETLTVDRITPGCHGGTYRRNNIRPACGPCNSETGSRLRRKG